MDEPTFQTVLQYVGFGQREGDLLRKFAASAESRLHEVVNDFYAALEAEPATKRILRGPAQIERLKQTLHAWLHSVLTGPHDTELLLNHSRIGRVHVRIGLPQQFMLTAMNRIRNKLLEIARALHEDAPTDLVETARAINQILDVELALILDTYREDSLQRQRASERLATIGQIAASIGHELRNPLSTVESSLYLIQRRLEKLNISDQQIEKHHQKIWRQLKHCDNTITNLLDLARDRPAQRALHAVHKVISAAVGDAAPPGEVVLKVDCEPDLQMYVDEDALRLVLVNLLRNSIEAMTGGGTIRVQAQRRTGGIEFTVHDSGPGIPEQMQSRVFDALFTTKAHGTGLGLALSQRILHSHGGEIALERNRPGARFRFFIPDEDQTHEPIH